MRTLFDEKLTEIHEDFLELGRMVNEAIDLAIQSLINHDVELAQQVIEGDKKINQKENMIDQKCYEIIALEQPNTSDLRRVLAVMRASSDLERMGDHAENISEVTIAVTGQKQVAHLEEIINEMGDKIKAMSVDILEAFVDFDVEKAVDTAKRDEEINQAYKELRKAVIHLVKEDQAAALVASDYSFVGMHLERIGDYIKNIGEWIVYLDTGKITDLD